MLKNRLLYTQTFLLDPPQHFAVFQTAMFKLLQRSDDHQIEIELSKQQTNIKHLTEVQRAQVVTA